MSSVAAIAALGSYYAFAGTRELTQVEMLVSFPMFLSAWLLVTDQQLLPLGGRCCGLAGLFAGVAVTFKLFYAPIFIAFVLVAILATRPRTAPGQSLSGTPSRCCWPFTIGVTVVLGAVSLILWRQGVFDELLWNSFVYPLLGAGWDRRRHGSAA